MSWKEIATLTLLILPTLFLTTPAPVQAQERLDHRDDFQMKERLDHRDDFQMNSISGGDFRDYISEHVREDDRWGYAMRMFGTFHNHMHEMMTDLARYGSEQLGDGDRIPQFDNRISGGEWGDYRGNLERDGVETPWKDFVQITEIMHDRVHHAMYKSVVYDLVSRARGADLHSYVGEDRAPHPTEEAVLRTDQVNTEYAPMDGFREFVWGFTFEHRHFHAAMQAMIVFDEMLHVLMTDWAAYGAEKEDAGCRPPEFGARITRTAFHAYAASVEDCSEPEWRNLVQVVALMHDRIHDMMYRVMLYDGAAHGREEESASSWRGNAEPDQTALQGSDCGNRRERRTSGTHVAAFDVPYRRHMTTFVGSADMPMYMGSTSLANDHRQMVSCLGSLSFTPHGDLHASASTS